MGKLYRLLYKSFLVDFKYSSRAQLVYSRRVELCLFLMKFIKIQSVFETFGDTFEYFMAYAIITTCLLGLSIPIIVYISFLVQCF